MSGVRWTVGARVAILIITWPATIIVMRLLNPHDYGVMAMSTIVIGFANLFGEPGLAAGLVKARELRDDTTRAASGVIVVLNVVIFVVIVLGAPAISAWFKEPQLVAVIRVASISLIFTALTIVPQTLMERELRFRETALALVAGNLAGSVFTVAGAYLGLGVWALVFGMLALALSRSVIVIYFNRSIVWPDFSAGLAPVRHLMHFSSHIIASRLLWYWYANADLLILGRLLRSASVGSYSVGASLAGIPTDKAMDALNRVSYPTLSRLSDNPAIFNITYRRLMAILALYGFAVCWGIAAVAPEFVHVVLSDKWLLAITPLTMLSIVAPLRMLTSFQNTVNNAAGSPQETTKLMAITSVALPLGILFGAWKGYGIDGAATSWLILYPFIMILSTLFTCRAINLRIQDGLRPIVVPLVSGAGMFLVVRIIRTVLAGQISPIALLGTETVIGAAGFLGIAGLIGREVLRDGRNLMVELLRPSVSAAGR